MKFADLHLHTIFSDSTYTPEELILEVSRLNLSAIAVVDHDSVEGIEPTKELAKTKNIEVIEGVEFTAQYKGQEVHILGYLIDDKRENLRETLDAIKKERRDRVYKMVDKLEDMGIVLNAQEVFDLAKQGSVGRLHIARAMLNKGVVGSLQEAFQKYIGEDCPAYVLGFHFSVRQAIRLIKDIGGIPVLAHPYSLNSLNQDELIREFMDYGLMGLEVYYPEHTPSMTRAYLSLAKKYNLLVTGGSDCHGNAKPKVKVGSIKIPYSLVEELKAAKVNPVRNRLPQATVG